MRHTKGGIPLDYFFPTFLICLYWLHQWWITMTLAREGFMWDRKVYPLTIKVTSDWAQIEVLTGGGIAEFILDSRGIVATSNNHLEILQIAPLLFHWKGASGVENAAEFKVAVLTAATKLALRIRKGGLGQVTVERGSTSITHKEWTSDPRDFELPLA